MDDQFGGQTQQDHAPPPLPARPLVELEAPGSEPHSHFSSGQPEDLLTAPPLPQRHPHEAELPPPPPPGFQGLYHAPHYEDKTVTDAGSMPHGEAGTQPLTEHPYLPPPPPQRHEHLYDEHDDLSNPIHYARDPRKVIAYLVPFPKPQVKGVDPLAIPDRFLIYTPPPPPLTKPKDGEKEAKFHKVQRKWQEEVKQAKTSDAKTASWKGVKGKATKGIDWAMGKTTTSSLDFLNRMGTKPEAHHAVDTHHDDGVAEAETTKRTVAAEEIVLVYPTSLPGTPEQLREDFVNTMLRAKTKAQRDAVLATGLLPVSFAIDVLATLVWPFGGLVEIDSVWLYSSARGAKIARNTTKRLTSAFPASASPDAGEGTLKLTFTPSARLEVLRRYLATSCHERNRVMFTSPGPAPTATQVLDAIGWAPSGHEAETRNWEDDQWEVSEVKEDLKQTMGKGGREWEKWCRLFEKEPQKALKK